MLENYKLGELLTKKNYSLASAESLTGGEFGYEVTSHPGSSEYYKGGMITYINEIKEKLGVKSEILDTYGAVSSETAISMAVNAKKFFESDVSISFTGNAGPTSLEGKPVGLVYCGICIQDQIYVYSNIFSGNRQEIREKVVKFGIELLENLLED